MLVKTAPTEKVKLVMFESVSMPVSVASKDEKGKTIFTKTGQMEEYTTYTFRDTFEKKIVFTTKNNNYRNLEGEFVDIELEIVYDDFNNKVKTKLASVTKSVVSPKGETKTM